MHKLVAATAAVVLGLAAAATTAHADGEAPAPRVLQYWYDLSPNACSGTGTGTGTGTVMIQLDQSVAAVIARWTLDQPLPVGGPVTEYIVAPRTDPDFGSIVELGAATGCGISNPDTIPMTELAAGGHLELVAMRADGSRVTVRGMPPRIATGEMPVDTVGLAHALRKGLNVPSYSDDDQIVQQVPAGWNPMRGIDTALWAGLGVCLVVAGGCILLFRRRPTLRPPTE